MARLTERLIGSLKVPPGKKDRIVFDDECRGLGVRVTAAGTRVFLVQWHDRGAQRKRREPLGTWGSLTTAQAREAARALLGGVARGIDPAVERKRQKEQADAERAEAA